MSLYIEKLPEDYQETARESLANLGRISYFEVLATTLAHELIFNLPEDDIEAVRAIREVRAQQQRLKVLHMESVALAETTDSGIEPIGI